MSDIVEIPADIMQPARDVYERLFRLGKHTQSSVPIDPLNIIVDAILAERNRARAEAFERAAQIAEDGDAPSWTYDLYDGGGTRDGWQMACSAIRRAAIRAEATK